MTYSINRRSFLNHVGLAGVGTGLSGPLLAAGVSPATPTPVIRATPAVFAPGGDGATVIWPVAERSVGWVEYGEAGTENAPGRIARADGFGFIPNDDRVLRVRLTGLVAGRDYWYRTHTRPAYRTTQTPADLHLVTGPVYTLRIANPDAKETRFCIWNDTHDVPATLAGLASLTRAEAADFLFWNGDVSNNIDHEADIPGLYLQPRGEVDLAKGPPILFVRGNHDVRGAEASRLPRYIDYPAGRPYYSFRSGPVGVIVLDTGEDKPDDHPSFLGQADFAALIREQAEWLAREIEKPHLKSAPYRVLFCHIPLRWRDESTPDYANGGYDHWSARGRAAWHAPLVKWGAQVVISGHTHQRHFMPPSPEFPYAQLVGGGPGRAGLAGGDRPYLIVAKADAERLSFRLLDLPGGTQVFETSFLPQRA